MPLTHFPFSGTALLSLFLSPHSWWTLLTRLDSSLRSGVGHSLTLANTTGGSPTNSAARWGGSRGEWGSDECGGLMNGLNPIGQGDTGEEIWGSWGLSWGRYIFCRFLGWVEVDWMSVWWMSTAVGCVLHPGVIKDFFYKPFPCSWVAPPMKQIPHYLCITVVDEWPSPLFWVTCFSVTTSVCAVWQL